MREIYTLTIYYNPLIKTNQLLNQRIYKGESNIRYIIAQSYSMALYYIYNLMKLNCSRST